MKILNKNILLIITVFSFTTLNAQNSDYTGANAYLTNTNKYEIFINASPLYTKINVNSYTSNIKGKAGFNVGAGLLYNYRRFNRFSLQFSAGLGFNQYNSCLALNYYDSVNTTDADADPILLYESATGLTEDYKISSVNIPVLVSLNYSINSKLSAYVSIGPYLSLLTKSSYSSSMLLSRSAYYPKYNALLHNIDVDGSPFYYPENKPVKSSGNIKVNSNIGLQFLAGAKYKINNNVSVFAGFNFYKNLNNLVNNTKTNFTLSNDNGNIGSLIQNTNSVKTMAVGAQIGISVTPLYVSNIFTKKRKAKNYQPALKTVEVVEPVLVEPQVVEVVVDTVIVPEVVVAPEPEKHVVAGKITQPVVASGNKPKVNIQFAQNSMVVDSVMVDSTTGEYHTGLKPGKYIIGVTADNHIPVIDQIEITDTDSVNMPHYELNSNITFKFDKDEPTQESYLLLDNICASLIVYPTVKIEVRGHADSSGIKEVNDMLSLKRAESIVKYMLGKGVNPGQITAVGCGSSEPIGDNNTAIGRSQNRRVEIKVVAF